MIIATVAATLLFWLFVWPTFVRFSLRHPGSWNAPLRHHIGMVTLVTTGVIATLYWVGAVELGNRFHYDVNWSDARGQFTALGVAAAITFTYTNFLPPAFDYGLFTVTDALTGAWDPKSRSDRLCVPAASQRGVFLAIYNTGASTWSGYRINVGFGEGFVPTAPPADWDWTGGPITFGKVGGWLQIDRSVALAPTEPHIFRFMLDAPAKPGHYFATITVGCAGRLGETRARMPVDVC